MAARAGPGAPPVRAADDPDAITTAAAILRDGGLVAVPTETVYGLAADAGSAPAVVRLFAAKGRRPDNPLIVHIARRAEAGALVATTPLFTTLAHAFWPGPLTLIADRRPTAPVAPAARAGLDSLAVRIPAHPAAQALLAAFGGPLVMPSANRSGHVSPTSAAAVAADLGDVVDLILDAGPCAVGLESTVVDTRGAAPAILRPGAIGRSAVAMAAGTPTAAARSGPAASPGLIGRHYAPDRARLRLNAVAPRPDEAYLGFGPCGWATVNLSPAGDMDEAARRLFAALRALDGAGFRRIAVAPIPNHGVGEAINDRLRRAAAP